MTDRVTPSCRYGHGDLIAAIGVNKTPQWAIMAFDGGPSCFEVRLFVCPKCGYMELFDPDFQKTAEADK